MCGEHIASSRLRRIGRAALQYNQLWPRRSISARWANTTTVQMVVVAGKCLWVDLYACDEIYGNGEKQTCFYDYFLIRDIWILQFEIRLNTLFEKKNIVLHL